MTDTTAAAATQAELDAQAHEACQRSDGNKAAAARELGVSASTVAERIRRHLARGAQDTAVEAPADEEPTAREAPAGLNAGDQLACAVECEARDCGALPGEPCISLNRDGSVVAQPWAHPQRIAAGKASAAAGAEAVQACAEPGAGLGGGEDRASEPEEIAGGEITETAADAAGDASPAPAGPEDTAPAELVSECADCGFHFSRPQRRRTCQSAKACRGRREARAAAAAGR